MSIKISQATVGDARDIMRFMNDIWKKGHILSYHKELFFYEFQEGKSLNFIVAKRNKYIVGLFGFIKYNSLNIPDIAGSLWKVDPSVKEPLLGMKMREYFLRNIPHRFFAAPGAGLQTKPIYRAIKMDWNRMNHFYIANDSISEFRVIQNPNFKRIETTIKSGTIYKASSIEDLKSFIFDEDILPLKDFMYIEKRYFQHPIYIYDTWYLKVDGVIKNIFVARLLEVNNRKVYRIVDFFGSLEYLKNIALFLDGFMKGLNIEYTDFINYGLDKKILVDAGFSILDLDSTETIVPNFFEPFLKKNVPIYCVSNKTDKEFRQFKADGDQDRPNQLESR